MSNRRFFTFNGQRYFTEHGLTLSELMNYFNYNTLLFVLEYNNLICNKKSWNKVRIKNNDKIEIVTIVGGG